MAKKLFAAKALVNITHNFVSIKIGETLKVTAEDANELLEKNYIEMIDAIPNENISEDQQGGE